MKVIIAEKPSVAREIAAIVGAKSRQDGFIEGNGYAVTWAFGHLVGPVLPQEYGYTGFRAENLPILPNPFIIKPRQIREGKEYKSDPGAVKQLEIIRRLFAKCDRIIVATDAGREGELIFRYIYSYLECNKPFDRLWISSLTDKAIRDGLAALHPGSEYDNLYLSAKARSEADWLVGINASQALSIAARRGVWSLGRVQTPTLAIICSRYLENTAFTPETYFQVKLHTAKDATAFAALSTDRYKDNAQGAEIIERVRRAAEARVTGLAKKEVTQQPPLLYDLTTLQKDMNSKYGFSADKTLSIAQKLYEDKLITYPRTGSRYISDDLTDEIHYLTSMHWDHPVFGQQLIALHNFGLNPRPVDNKKITDHHAILYTRNMPGKDITDDEVKVYDRIVSRVAEAFSDSCIKDVTTVKMEADGIPFEVKGTVVKRAGWRKVLGEAEEKEDGETAALPKLSEGDTLPVRDAELLEKQTKPRPIHTESSLLSAMETAGRDLEDEAEREAMKESGIGTPATRAAIIETLFSREYIRREKKSLIPTEKGLAVYELVKDKKIADAAMTGSWELALSKIATGEMDAFTFHQGIEVYASQVTAEILAVKVALPGGMPTHTCPRCKTGQVVFYEKVARCDNGECNLAVYRNKAKKMLTDKQITDLLKNGKTSVITGFQNKTTGKIFDAIVAFDEDYNTMFTFPPKKNTGKGKRK